MRVKIKHVETTCVDLWRQFLLLKTFKIGMIDVLKPLRDKEDCQWPLIIRFSGLGFKLSLVLFHLNKLSIKRKKDLRKS